MRSAHASVDPDSADAFAMLGFVQFASDHTPDAIRSWKKALALRPDAVVSQYLARAERESTAESEFSQRESSHFNLHYEGKDTSESFRRDCWLPSNRITMLWRATSATRHAIRLQ